MTWKAVIILAAALIVLTAAPGSPTVGAASAAGCEPGAKIDDSTAADAKQKIETAGFQQVHDLTKGCDNFWHGTATKDGEEIHVVLSPQGQVMREGN